MLETLKKTYPEIKVSIELFLVKSLDLVWKLIRNSWNLSRNDLIRHLQKKTIVNSNVEVILASRNVKQVTTVTELPCPSL